MSKRRIGRLVLFSLLISAQNLWASDGQQIAINGLNGGAVPACQTCHGDEGLGNAAAGVPRLAGQGEDYLRKQLADFKAGHRKNDIMSPIAAAMNDMQIKAVAKYYGSLAKPAVVNTNSQDVNNIGARLAHKGDWEKDVPACFRCHGDKGLGVAPHMPAIVGQPSTYIVNQLKAWRAGARANDPVGVMGAVASRLSDDEINKVADYLSTLDPAAP